MAQSECGFSQDDVSQRPCQGSEEVVHSSDESQEGEDDPDILMPLNVEIPNNDSLNAMKQHLEHEKSKFAHLFKNSEQLEFFLMLPLSKEQRRILLNQLVKEQ